MRCVFPSKAQRYQGLNYWPKTTGRPSEAYMPGALKVRGPCSSISVGGTVRTIELAHQICSGGQRQMASHLHRRALDGTHWFNQNVPPFTPHDQRQGLSPLQGGEAVRDLCLFWAETASDGRLRRRHRSWPTGLRSCMNDRPAFAKDSECPAPFV